MDHQATRVFYGLSIFVLMTALFILGSPKTQETAQFQQEVKQSLNIAWQQVWSDQPYFTEISNIYGGIAAFYEQASSSAIVLISFPQADADIVFVFGEAYEVLAYTIANKLNGSVLGDQFAYVQENYMAEPPIYNIVPDTWPVPQAPQVLGVETTASYPEPGSFSNPWFTATDGLTGQLYCIAIYNGEVNQYLGPCKYDYY